MEIFVSLIFITIFLAFLTKFSFRDEETIYSKILDKCSFQRIVLRSAEIKENYLKSKKCFELSRKKYITNRFFKTLEFSIAELIILNLMLIRKSKDLFTTFHLQEQNHRLITKYLSIFEDKDLDLIKNSLICRFLMNLYSLNTDTFTLYNEINSFLFKEIKAQISYDFVLYTKKNHWYSQIEFDYIYLQVLDSEILKF